MLGKKRRLQQTEELLNEVLDVHKSNMIVVRGGDCQFLYTSQAAKDFLKRERLRANTCRETFAAMMPGLCEKCINSEDFEESDTQRASCKIKSSNERMMEVTTTAVSWPDRDWATALFFEDIEEKMALENKLYSLAYNDQLTGMPNRRKLIEISGVITKAKSEKRCGVVAMLDLDNFKIVNDTYGHNTGDIMLKRLTEYLNEMPEFEGCLYRLGGDEFILMIDTKVSDFENEAEIRKHFAEILSRALYSYTLPNIEHSCTVSMGVAFFPLHGETLSDLLRKADIALYKSKENGRNQLTFFEDVFETSRKFKDFYINIQPVFSKDGSTYGYLLRDSGSENEPGKKNINLKEVDRAIDALGIDALNNAARYFIDYSPRLHIASVAKNLPKDKFIVQIDLPKEISDEEFATYRLLNSRGFVLAFNGLVEANTTRRVMEMARYGCFEPGKISESEQKRIIAAYPHIYFIAAGVDEKADFDRAKEQGFKLFQGALHDFAPPVVKMEKDVSPLRMNYLRLLKLTSGEDYVDFTEITHIIESDVALSYMLLKLLNSVAIGLRNRISSIAMAINLLGEENLKKWIALLSVRGIGEDKPLELVRLSLIRAQFGELLVEQMKGVPPRNKKYAFLTGMFSLLHIAMEKSKEKLLEEIPVAEDIKESILTKEGPYSDLLQFFEDYEQSNWDGVTNFADRNGLSSQVIYEAYIGAVSWYKDLSGDADD